MPSNDNSSDWKPPFPNNLNYITLKRTHWSGDLPFLSSYIPKILHGNVFFMEVWEDDRMYLRSFANLYFVRPVRYKEIAMTTADHPQGDPAHEEIMPLWYVELSGQSYSLGYRYNGRVEMFVPVVFSDKKMSEISDKHRFFYLSTRLEDPDFIETCLDASRPQGSENERRSREDMIISLMLFG